MRTTLPARMKQEGAALSQSDEDGRLFVYQGGAESNDRSRGAFLFAMRKEALRRKRTPVLRVPPIVNNVNKNVETEAGNLW